MFLMKRSSHKKYRKLLLAYIRRCREMERGVFRIKPGEKKRVMKAYNKVKKDLIRKLKKENKKK